MSRGLNGVPGRARDHRGASRYKHGRHAAEVRRRRRIARSYGAKPRRVPEFARDLFMAEPFEVAKLAEAPAKAPPSHTGGISAATLGIFATAFVGLSFALVHVPARGLHPHLLALSSPGTVRNANSPEAVAVRDLDVLEAGPGGPLPVVGDLSVLKTAEAGIRPPSEIARENRNSESEVQAEREPGGLASQGEPQSPLDGEDGGVPVEVAQLPPLSLAPLDGAITATEKSLEALGSRDRLCEVETFVTAPLQVAALTESNVFGRALAAAALRQTGDFVVYTDKYRHMSFPMGDVPSMFGVCTDVVIRAYRTLGIDLQARIYDAHIGSGDKSIAHRRTFTLRRYFASRGASLPITPFAEDYLAGDIVTYHRPQNKGSRDHIAIVTDIIARSGRPMIVHNRGWGPQLEDALFVDRMTGHYRYQGQTEPYRQKARTESKRKPASRHSAGNSASLRHEEKGTSEKDATAKAAEPGPPKLP